MGKVYVISCPLCGLSRRYSEEEFERRKIFPKSRADYFVKEMEVGGSIKTGRGVGVGKAEGRAETLETYTIDDLGKYEYIRDLVVERLEETLERLKA